MTAALLRTELASFAAFVDALGRRFLWMPCSDRGAIHGANCCQLLWNGKITVVNAAASDPAGWANNTPGTPPHFGEFLSDFKKLGFDPAHLDDGDAIANHDALVTAIKAVRLASQAPPTPNGVPKLIDVFHQILNLNTLNLVPGVSGNLTYQFRGQNGDGEDSGNPCDKPIPILETPPSEMPSPPYLTACS